MSAAPPRTTLARVIISVSDQAEALAFYAGHLGLTVTRTTAEFAWLRTSDGIEVMLHQRPAHPSDTSVAVAFTVPDLDSTVTAWARAGGQIIDPPAAQPWGEYMAVVRDADRHIVCLVQHP